MPALTRSQLAACILVAVAGLVLAGRWLSAHRAPETPGPGADGTDVPAGAKAAGWSPDGPAASSPRAEGPLVEETPEGTVLVHVAGAVRHPGVYRLQADARVRDAVERAGGPARRGDPNGLNLAAVVQDGTQVVVPRRVPPGAVATPPAAGGVGEGATAAPAAPVNLNTASSEELQTLSGVGPATAAAIIEYRAQNGGFRSVDDLDQVPGIGPKTMEELRDAVTV